MALPFGQHGRVRLEEREREREYFATSPFFLHRLASSPRERSANRCALNDTIPSRDKGGLPFSRAKARQITGRAREWLREAFRQYAIRLPCASPSQTEIGPEPPSTWCVKADVDVGARAGTRIRVVHVKILPCIRGRARTREIGFCICLRGDPVRYCVCVGNLFR